jgi:hypothetical protein
MMFLASKDLYDIKCVDAHLASFKVTRFNQKEQDTLPHSHLIVSKEGQPGNWALQLQAQDTQVSQDLHFWVY